MAYPEQESKAGTALRRNHLLAQLSEATRCAIAARLHLQELGAGDVLQQEDAPVPNIYFPVRGVIASALVMPYGTEVVSGLIGREGATCHDPSCGRAFSKLAVLVSGAAWRLPSEEWRSLLDDRQARAHVLSYCALRALESQQNAACNLLHDVESRLCRWILQLHDRVEGSTIHLTHAGLATVAGIRRSTVTLILGALQNAGIIDTRRGTIEIVDRFALQSAACDCYGAISARHAAVERGMEAGGGAGDQRWTNL